MELIKCLQGFTSVRTELCQLMSRLAVPDRLDLAIGLFERDNGRLGLMEWIVQHHILSLERSMGQLVELGWHHNGEHNVHQTLLGHSIATSFDFLLGLVPIMESGSEPGSGEANLMRFMTSESQMGPNLRRCFALMLEHDLSTLSAFSLAQLLLGEFSGGEFLTTLMVTSLRSMRLHPPPFSFSETLSHVAIKAVDDVLVETDDFSRVHSELGYALTEMAADGTMSYWGDATEAARCIVHLLEVIQREKREAADVLEMEYSDATSAGLITLDGLSEASFQRLAELADRVMPAGSRLLSSFTPFMNWSDFLPSPLNPPLTAEHGLATTTGALKTALLGGATAAARPSTPAPPSTPPTILGMGTLYGSLVILGGR